MATPATKALLAGFWSLVSYLSFFLTLATSWKNIYGLESLGDAFRRNLFSLAVLVVIFHPHLQDEFLNGQVNLLMLGALAGFFFSLEKNRLFWAAFFLALATSVKIAPGFCLLYVVFSRQYRVVGYFLPLVFLFTVGLPYLINENSLQYYHYFVTEVMPVITDSDLTGRFKSYSIISTASRLFQIQWYPPLKIAALIVLAGGLALPILRYARREDLRENMFFRFVSFGAIVSILPLTFPMSEGHHLLLQVVPFVAVVAYWRRLVAEGRNLFRDRISLIFLLSAAGFQLGHAFKETPLRLVSLIGVYLGMVLLLRLGKRVAGPGATGGPPSGARRGRSAT